MNKEAPNKKSRILFHSCTTASFTPTTTTATTYVSATHVLQRYAISRATLRRWADAGKLAFVRAHGDGKRLYSSTDIDRLFGNEQRAQQLQPPAKTKILYARVSSEKQRGDLERQVADLQQAVHPYQQLYEVIKDVGSGLNWQRRGFQALLERVHKGEIGEVMVFHKDRLCRFGFELVEWIFAKAGVKLVVLSADLTSRADDDAREQQELADDLLSIVTIFVAKHNGRRSATNRKHRKAEAKTAARRARAEKKTRREESQEASSGEESQD
jgi:predicted site-specific integrase-resolvase